MNYRIVFRRHGRALPSTLLLTESTLEEARQYAVFSLQAFHYRYDWAEITDDNKLCEIVLKPDRNPNSDVSMVDWGNVVVPAGQLPPGFKEDGLG